jgi:hypothetical protein
LRLAVCNLLGVGWSSIRLLGYLIHLFLVPVLAFTKEVVLRLLLGRADCLLLVYNLRVYCSSDAKTAKFGILPGFWDVCSETGCVLSIVGDFLHCVELLVVFTDCVRVEDVLLLVTRGNRGLWSRLACSTIVSTVRNLRLVIDTFSIDSSAELLVITVVKLLPTRRDLMPASIVVGHSVPIVKRCPVRCRNTSCHRLFDSKVS